MILKELEYFGVKIQIVWGDITEESVDAIVNAANENLKHGGGVAAAIVEKGGYVIQRESDEIVMKYGHVKTGNAVVTSAGRLKAKYVIHTVGPIWHGGGMGEDNLLYSALYSSLLRAYELGIKSISIPAISTGIFGFPKTRAVGIFVSAIKDFIDSHQSGTLKNIRICNIDLKTAKMFNTKFKL